VKEAVEILSNAAEAMATGPQPLDIIFGGDMNW
jgi:hypothetical protein